MAQSVLSANDAGGIVNISSGVITGDASVVTIHLGFVARYFQIVNSTDAIVWTKLEGMAAANSVKVVTAGDQTIDTGSAILLKADGTVVLSATLADTAKALAWIAFG